MRFDNPVWFFLLAALPLALYLRRRRKPAGLLYSSLALLPPMSVSRTAALAKFVPPALRLLALALIITALARPVLIAADASESVDGIDIVLVNDVSSSMTAKDLGSKTRLDYAREVVKDFISRRPSDRIGLVVFSGRAYTQAPLTIDHDILISLVDQMQTGLIDDGTAIGMALGTAVNRLKDSKARSKVIILLTDGENNAGVIDPITAAQICESFGIKVYTIGVGSREGYRFTVRDPASGQLMTGMYSFNETLLKEIARTTAGNYFNATSASGLRDVYHRIDALEKTEMEVKHYEKKTEIFTGFALTALLVILLELALQETIFRRIPA